MKFMHEMFPFEIQVACFAQNCLMKEKKCVFGLEKWFHSKKPTSVIVKLVRIVNEGFRFNFISTIKLDAFSCPHHFQLIVMELR